MEDFKNHRKQWYELKEDKIRPNFEKDSLKSEFITVIYSQLYSEVREKEKSQQQLVTWSITMLTGSSFVSLISKLHENNLAIFILILVLLLGTWILTSGIISLAKDRMSIGRQLDRIHKVMETFKK